MLCEARALILHLFPTDYHRTICVTRARAPTKRTGVEPLFIRWVCMRPLCTISKTRSRLPWLVSILLISNNVPEPEVELVSSP